VRLLKLEVGSLIKEHRDYDLGFEKEQLRLHVPVTTNPDVDFFLDGHRLNLSEGECWYLDLSLPHWVENRGSSDRIHLVIDCELNEWLGDLIQVSTPLNDSKTDSTSSSPEALERFRQLVLSDLTLQQRLRETADPESFIRLVVDTGHKRGCHFTAQDASEALQTARREWAERWID
jgi:aspartyl/asparaginyl beta-hydroxylase (cupin superfamily)